MYDTKEVILNKHHIAVCFLFLFLFVLFFKNIRLPLIYLLNINIINQYYLAIFIYLLMSIFLSLSLLWIAEKKLRSIFKLFKVFDLLVNQIEYFCGLDVSDTCNKNRIRFYQSWNELRGNCTVLVKNEHIHPNRQRKSC